MSRKPKNAVNKGAGLWDFLKDPVGHVTEAFRSIPSKINNESRKTLEKFGNQRIIKVDVARTPLNPTINGALNSISFGEFEKMKDKFGYNAMFHLSLIPTLESGQQIMIQKNEVIQIIPLEQSGTLNNKTEYLTLAMQGHTPTLLEAVDKTRSYMGETKFYDYDGFLNNCQNFVLSFIQANGWMTNWAKDWIDQKAHRMKEHLEQNNMGYVHNMMNKVTKMGSFVSRLVGKGAKKTDVNKYANQHKLTLKDLEWVANNKVFVKFIKEHGWEGL